MPTDLDTPETAAKKVKETASDHLSDPLRHSPLDRKSVLETGRAGSGTLVNVAHEWAKTEDGKFSATKSFLHQKKTHPELSDEELWERALQYDINPGGEITRLEGFDQTSGEAPSTAFVVGNSDYEKKGDDLPGARADASSMASHYASKGYEVIKGEDLTGAELRDGLQVMDTVGPGERAVFYFAGHGNSRGLVGVDHKQLWYSETSRAVTEVLGRGGHLDIVLDACHGGGLLSELEYEVGSTRTGSDLPHATAEESGRLGYGMGETEVADDHRINLMEGQGLLGKWSANNDPFPVDTD